MAMSLKTNSYVDHAQAMESIQILDVKILCQELPRMLENLKYWSLSFECIREILDLSSLLPSIRHGLVDHVARLYSAGMSREVESFFRYADFKDNFDYDVRECLRCLKLTNQTTPLAFDDHAWARRLIPANNATRPVHYAQPGSYQYHSYPPALGAVYPAYPSAHLRASASHGGCNFHGRNRRLNSDPPTIARDGTWFRARAPPHGTYGTPLLEGDHPYIGALDDDLNAVGPNLLYGSTHDYYRQRDYAGLHSGTGATDLWPRTGTTRPRHFRTLNVLTDCGDTPMEVSIEDDGGFLGGQNPFWAAGQTGASCAPPNPNMRTANVLNDCGDVPMEVSFEE